MSLDWIIDDLKIQSAVCDASGDSKRVSDINKAIEIIKNNYTRDDELTTRVRRLIYRFTENNGWRIQDFEITHIDAFHNGSNVEVKITSGRPGILIGKGGRTIDSIKEYLSLNGMGVNVNIRILESKLWH